MYVMSTFEHSIYVELALSALEMKSISKENILAVPLNNRKEDRKLFDTIHYSDGLSLFDLAVSLATAFAVVGSSVGFRLEWGPIIWGILYAIIGFIIGLLINLLKVKKKKKNRLKKGKTSELIIIVHCLSDQVQMVEQIMWDNLALGVAKMDNSFTQE
ncbi:hypothetical protein [Paenisporosarcina antarctica]|uniref:Uncharacterized protein n=1 Tax=Paenisporosarcina antarctica TaxID=417367 RepID=A0A4P6ZVP4_9BACL|nr:hypothetical protein [Paenisporosarcina antarctica]QBP40234.1 hypothetical protein E2636_03305 [Paenisporosarcina antarctica]